MCFPAAYLSSITFFDGNNGKKVRSSCLTVLVSALLVETCKATKLKTNWFIVCIFHSSICQKLISTINRISVFIGPYKL